MSLEERALLEDFVVDNPDLEKLESLLAEFNIFEALWRKAWRESYHSDFLAFLIDPVQNHGLGDSFLKQFLKRVLSDAQTPISDTEEIETMNLQTAFVERERWNIDILVQDSINHLACIVENKIDASERVGQLDKYWGVVKQKLPGYQTIFIYLTPDGREPVYDSHNVYIPFSYDSIIELIETFCQTTKVALNSQLLTLMSHYNKTLRKHIVRDTEIARLCRKIYHQHKQALNLIFEHIPLDLQSQLAEELRQLVTDTEDNDLYLYEDESSKKYVGFYDDKWYDLYTQQGWSEDIDPFYFEFENYSDELWLFMGINSANAPQPILQAIHQFALSHPQTFLGVRPRLNPRFTTIYKKQFLISKNYEDADFDSLIEKLKVNWHKFLTQDLPAIRQALAEIEWPSPNAPN
jgi:hypothetical protein